MTTTLGINHLLKRFPRELSNGQRQRVALGRVLVRPADIYLLDEPLSHLDAKLRAAMRAELKQLGAMSKTTTIYVTHDYQEALALGDRVAVMREGSLVQIGTPKEIWRRPADTFVARALGQPEINILDGVVDNGRIRLADGSFDVPVPAGVTAAAGERVRVGLRPCDIHVTGDGGPAGFAGTVVLAERLGRNIELTVDVGGEQVIVLASGRRRRRRGCPGVDDRRRHRCSRLRRRRWRHPPVGCGRQDAGGSAMSVMTSRTDGARSDASATGQSLTLTDLVKTYASRGRESVTAVKGIDLEIEPGELVALLGPSGCGKTTTLRMIAGLETVTSGSIRIGDREISQLPASKRGIGVGFESYALYPPMSVRENLLYGLKARKVKGAEQMVDSISRRLEMDDMMGLRPAGLSSGQKQRVALARALVRNPPVLLLDEPLSHLDASARQRVRRELKVLQREFGYTTIVVTHDQVEALSLADRLAVMDAGVVQQFGTPDEVFDDPANLFVAQFVGEPQINVLRGVAKTADGKVTVEIGTNAGALETAATGVADGTNVAVGIRPQDCAMSTGEGPGLRTTVAYFEHLLEFGLATTTVAGHRGGHRRPDPRPGRLRARAKGCGERTARAGIPVRRGHRRAVAMTKLFNDPARFTEDMLAGFLDANAKYVVGVPGGVVRAQETPPGKVAVVIGGGSGHYPAFCGTVGTGFADGAVVGNIFTSPSAEEAASVARAAHGDAGVLLTTGNYAGDVMNFGLAVTQLRSEGIDAHYFAVTDDIASAPKGEEAKRRGIAGDFTVFKCASAAAEDGLDIQGVIRVAEASNAATRTLGVAFDGCTLPGAEHPLFTVPDKQMGVGLGIHGEPGVRDEPMPSAADLAVTLVDGVLDDKPAGDSKRIAVILNGLGRTKYEELFVVWGTVARAAARTRVRDRRTRGR